MIVTRPNEQFTSSLAWDEFGDTTSLRWRLEDNSDNVVVARTNAGIEEFANGNYRRKTTAPETPGIYWVIWDNNDPDTSTREEAADELVVTFVQTDEETTPGESFISIPDLAAYLGYSITSEDPKGLLCVDGACELIRTLTGQKFTLAEDETILLDGTGTDTVLLPQYPALSVSAVSLEGEAVEDFMRTDSGLLRLPYPKVWTSGRQKVEVTYSHGYSEAPRDIRMLAVTIAARLYAQGIVSAETVGMAQVTYPTDSLTLTAGEMAIIKRYRIIKQDATVVGS